MAQTTGLLIEGKPIVEIAIADAIPTPSPVTPKATEQPFPLRQYRALLDTGADITCLTDRVVREARLSPYGMMKMTGGNGPSLHITYIIQLGIWCADSTDFEGENHFVRTLYQLPEPFEAPVIRDNRWFDVIIGTDILAQYDFRLKRGGEFTLTLT
jgi:hypothetical protein